jgi:DNA-binding NarL/FixJ family response regulator
MRVIVIADSLSRGLRVANLLSEGDDLEIVSTLTAAQAGDESLLVGDVIITAGLQEEQIPEAGLPVVALTGDVDATGWGSTIRAWLPLDAMPMEIAAALNGVANGLTILTSTQAKRWLPSGNPKATETLGESLTRREQEVLRLAADGLSNKELAAKLGISERTAKFHIGQIMAKLAASSRTEAVSIGIRRGIVPI